jgi:hypothetical protein
MIGKQSRRDLINRGLMESHDGSISIFALFASFAVQKTKRTSEGTETTARGRF